MNTSPWKHCQQRLEGELSAPLFNTWIRPLHAIESRDNIRLLAPNRFVLDWVNEHFMPRIRELIGKLYPEQEILIRIEIGSKNKLKSTEQRRPAASAVPRGNGETMPARADNLNSAQTFDTFVEGKSNQLARAAALQVSENPGKAYNPLFITGGVGLGKTHLMHAIGAAILERKPDASIAYLHSERFVADMVRALQRNAINEFKRHYRSQGALLIDDIQFFAGKERSQEEFFHTFNTLLEGQRQIVLTCDRYPKELNGLEERLKSRFGWA